MKKISSLLLLAIVFISSVSYAGDRTPRTKVASDNPKVVYGPVNDNPSSLLLESFESPAFPPAGWTKINLDGGTGWTRETVGTTPLPGWNGGVITTPPGGLTAVAYATWNTGGAVSNDQWLVTSQVTNVGADDSLSFWVQVPGYTNAYADSLVIMVSTTTPSSGSFSRVAGFGWNAGNTDTLWSKKSFKLTDFPGVTAGSNIYIAFREKVADNFNDGSAILLDLVQVTVLTSIQQTSTQTPGAYKLSQNYPNPFNPETNISFDIKDQGFVSLKVYDMIGREVADLVNKNLTAGSYTYNFNASKLNSGIYFYKLQTENFSQTKKMMLVK